MWGGANENKNMKNNIEYEIEIQELFPAKLRKITRIDRLIFIGMAYQKHWEMFVEQHPQMFGESANKKKEWYVKGVTESVINVNSDLEEMGLANMSYAEFNSIMKVNHHIAIMIYNRTVR